jgi:antitoxin component YwqK of YwqJK toxin-antitoxin module
MSLINGALADVWIEENHPENGLFRVYWKDVIGIRTGGATLDPDEGVGLRYEWYYKDGKRAEGISRGWDSDGKLRSLRTYNDMASHVHFEWYDNGQKKEEVTYKYGKPVGTHIKWYKNGQKRSEENYKNGKFNGLSTYWTIDGKENYELIWKDGNPWDGISINWYDSGQKRWLRNYKDGKEDGLWMGWHSNGQMMNKENYIDGIKTGNFVRWYENGQKQKEITY